MVIRSSWHCLDGRIIRAVECSHHSCHRLAAPLRSRCRECLDQNASHQRLSRQRKAA